MIVKSKVFRIGIKYYVKFGDVTWFLVSYPMNKQQLLDKRWKVDALQIDGLWLQEILHR